MCIQAYISSNRLHITTNFQKKINNDKIRVTRTGFWLTARLLATESRCSRVRYAERFGPSGPGSSVGRFGGDGDAGTVPSPQPRAHTSLAAAAAATPYIINNVERGGWRGGGVYRVYTQRHDI